MLAVADPAARQREEGHPVSAAEGWSVFSIAVIVTAVVGMAAVSADAVNWRALAALAHAQDVLRQEPRVNLALIGFVEPPLTSLFFIPIAWLAPRLAATGDAVWVLGAILAGLTLRTLNALCADVGVGRVCRWVLCALALANPVYLGLAATGAPDALYVLLLMAAAWALLRWQRDGALRDLISCSILLGLAFLARYDALMPIVAGTLVVVYQTHRTGGTWTRLEGTLITFLLPVLHVAGLWILANWLIIGDPWHFWRTWWWVEGGAPGPLGPVWQNVVGTTGVFAPVLAAVWWSIWGGASGRPRLATGAMLTLVAPPIAVLLLPNLFGGYWRSAREANLPLMPVPELFAPMLAAGWVLTAAMLGDVGALFRRKSITKEICLAGSAALLAAGILLVLGQDERVYLDPGPALVGQPFGAAEAGPTKAVAAKLKASAPPPGIGPVVVAGWPGYAVALYAARTSDKVLLVSTEPPAEVLKGPRAGAVLIRNGDLLHWSAGTRRRWERVTGTDLQQVPRWTLDGWAYYPRPVRPEGTEQ